MDVRILTLVASGITNDEITQQTGIKPGTIANRLHNIFRRFGITGRRAKTQIVLEGIRRRYINIDQLAKGVNFANFRNLSIAELDLLDAMTGEEGRVLSNTELKRRFNMSEDELKRIKNVIYSKLGVRNETQAVVANFVRINTERSVTRELGYVKLDDREIEYLELTALQYTRSEIAKRLAVSPVRVSVIARRIREKLQTQNDIQSIITAINQGNVPIHRVVEGDGDYSLITKLTEKQESILAVYIDDPSLSKIGISTLARRLNIAETSLWREQNRIIRALQVANFTQAILLYFAARQAAPATEVLASSEPAAGQAVLSPEDQQLFSQFYDNQFGNLLKHVQRFATGSPVPIDAESILQQAFVILYEHLPDIQNKDSREALTAYVALTARRLIYAEQKRGQIAQFTSMEDTAEVSESGNAESLTIASRLRDEAIDEEDFIKKSIQTDNRQQVQAVLNLMPSTERDLLEMFHMKGMSFEEIGAVLGMRPGTAQKRTLRARKLYKKISERLYSKR